MLKWIWCVERLQDQPGKSKCAVQVDWKNVFRSSTFTFVRAFSASCGNIRDVKSDWAMFKSSICGRSIEGLQSSHRCQTGWQLGPAGAHMWWRDPSIEWCLLGFVRWRVCRSSRQETWGHNQGRYRSKTEVWEEFRESKQILNNFWQPLDNFVNGGRTESRVRWAGEEN